MIHGRKNKPLFLLIAIVLLIFIVFSFDERYLYFAGILMSLYVLSRPIWYAANYRKIKCEWETVDALVCSAHVESVFHGQPHTIRLQLLNRDDGHMFLMAYRVMYIKLHEGEVVKVLYCSEHPDDFLIIPEYKYQISGDMIIGGILMSISIFGLFVK